ncbi:MAG: GIY-YIG nuclease family protein [Rhodospirillales bacterium]|nr:GIY-YIG nuclease family protein [Rhodospirillales bacterium]MCB9995580.1 GIY-YIG nuclease family protein [Rhodospirillales bacterium]
MGAYVYIITNERNGTLYIGVTSNLRQRVWQHKEGVVDGFSQKYGLKRLVWYEVHDDIREAIRREKQLKKWERQWKLRIIEDMNPQWKDLYGAL